MASRLLAPRASALDPRTTRKASLLAFLCCTHPRLGSKSPAALLLQDTGALRYLADWVLTFTAPVSSLLFKGSYVVFTLGRLYHKTGS